jgi:hypothetical protein
VRAKELDVGGDRSFHPVFLNVQVKKLRLSSFPLAPPNLPARRSTSTLIRNASEEDRKVRKRKLIQGSSVFRDARKDRPGK